MQNTDKQTIFNEKTKAYSIRVPEILMENVANEAATSGRSRDKQMIAILSERYGIFNTEKGE